MDGTDLVTVCYTKTSSTGRTVVYRPFEVTTAPSTCDRQRPDPVPQRLPLPGPGGVAQLQRQQHGGRARRAGHRRHRLLLVLQQRQRRAGGQGPRRHLAQRQLLGLLRRPVRRRVHHHGHRHSDRWVRHLLQPGPQPGQRGGHRRPARVGRGTAAKRLQGPDRERARRRCRARSGDGLGRARGGRGEGAGLHPDGHRPLPQRQPVPGRGQLAQLQRRQHGAPDRRCR